MLNYSVHALEELHNLDFRGLHPEDAAGLTDVKKHLREGVKFELPVNGCLFDGDIEKGFEVITPDLLYLPFPATVLEYPFELFTGDPTKCLHSPKRIAIALDYEKNKATFLGTSALRFCPRLEEAGGILLLPLSYMQGRWCPQPWGCIMPRYEPDGQNMSVYYYGNRKHPETTKVGFVLFPVMASAANRLMHELGTEAAIKNGLQDCGEEITSVIGLLAALSCSNIKLKDEPAPEKLNVKRVKNGKLPFFGYKVVTVALKAGAGAVKHTDTMGVGRQSPREHLRRGHIRQLEAGKRVWVQSAMIGSATKGKINKVYKVGGL